MLRWMEIEMKLEIKKCFDIELIKKDKENELEIEKEMVSKREKGIEIEIDSKEE